MCGIVCVHVFSPLWGPKRTRSPHNDRIVSDVLTIAVVLTNFIDFKMKGLLRLSLGSDLGVGIN